ncbi:MAG: YwiC-like family protein [Anaeromyxobacteraceae bacterium]
MAEPAPTEPSAQRALAERRTLVPREHGAYGQLAMPLLTALAIGRPRAASFLLTYALVVAFVAHEALLVAIGQRGRRVAEEDGPRARRVLALLGAQALLAGAAGFALAPPAARAALALPALLAVAVGAFVAARREKTIAGEVTVGAALSSGGLAVALAGGAPLSWALACWVTWVLGFAAATLAVQVILERARSKGRKDPGRAHAAASAALVVAALVAVPALGLPAAAPLALLPTAGLSIAVCLARFSPKRLRELGWAMVATTVLTMAILVAGLRLSGAA